MAGQAEDIRLFYSSDLVRTRQIAAVTGGPTALTEALPPGRYALHISPGAGTNVVWVRTGKFGSVTAQAATPSTPFALAVFSGCEINVMPGVNDGISAIAVGGATDFFVTRISNPAGEAR